MSDREFPDNVDFETPASTHANPLRNWASVDLTLLSQTDISDRLRDHIEGRSGS